MGGKSGFTLIEMVVVMAIIAILSLISVASLISAKNNTTAASAANDFVSNVRDAENRAFSVKKNTLNATDDTKVWAIHIANNATSYSLIPYIYSGDDRDLNFSGGVTNNPEATYDLPNGVTVTLTKVTGAATQAVSDSLYVAYAAPFARAAISEDVACVDHGDDVCNWRMSSRPAQDWEFDPDPDPYGGEPGNYISPTNDPLGTYYLVTFSYGSNSVGVKINQNGDVSID